jgi:transcriptional regulator with XRE-family HTH domain
LEGAREGVRRSRNHGGEQGRPGCATPGKETHRPAARRVRELRRRRGLTAAQLAERLREVGLDWDRNVVANLETGRRASLDVSELLALALVLDVAPVHLLVPLDDDRPYQITPTRIEQSGPVRDWVRGAEPLDGTDARAYWSEVPEVEWQQVNDQVQVHRGEQLGSYRERRLAKLLASDPELAAQLVAHRAAAEEELARLRRPPAEEGGKADG